MQNSCSKNTGEKTQRLQIFISHGTPTHQLQNYQHFGFIKFPHIMEQTTGCEKEMEAREMLRGRKT
jgi:hypothetical protein